jgi:hypothetical protein
MIRKHEQTYLRLKGCELDYSRAYWQPPLPAADAHRLECRQIENLGLSALVSMTDHDSIDSGHALHLVGIDAPISVEWTVPLGPTFVHIGIHNLPVADAKSWMNTFAEWTAKPNPDVLGEIFAALDALPQMLIVFNHPLWDENCIGRTEHRAVVQNFLERFGRYIHALELNGLRPWRENREVSALAAERGLPVISGGDRHGCEPNANVNLTNAKSFSDFVAEIREDRVSEVLFMPQYREPFNVRCAETMWDALRDYPEYPARQFWSDRIFFLEDDGKEYSLTELWKGAGPGIVRNFIGVMRVFQLQSVRTAIRFAFAERQEEMA